MRQFNFVLLDETDAIYTRYSLNYVTDISGLGFDLNVSTIATDIKDYITKIVQTKRNISLKIINKKKYNEMKNLVEWLQAYYSNNGKYTLCLEYINDAQTLYCEGIVITSNYDEVNKYKVLDNTIVFRPLTPFFKRNENQIRIQKSSEGKSYPLSYPYCYGVNITINNEIENYYLTDVPIIITINGAVTNPSVSLRNQDGVVYNQVRFDDFYLEEGEAIIINSAQKKIWFRDTNGNLTDFYSHINEAYDSYLRAAPGQVSEVVINLEASESGYLVGSWRGYTL